MIYKIGNCDILDIHKVGFLCPRKIPADIILKTYDWAIEQRDKGICIISGFHSKIEKDVLHFLLKGTQPIILVLARGLKKRYEPEIQAALDHNRLLIITQFNSGIKRATKETAYKRNELICELADEIFCPFVNEAGLTYKIVSKQIRSSKKVFTFDSENISNTKK